MDEALGMKLSSLVPDGQDDRYLSASNMTEAAMRGESHGEGWIQTKDGDQFWAQVVLRAITGDEDDIRGFVAVVRDMTEHRQRRRELEHQRDELVTLNRTNGVIRDIDRALVQARSRQEICAAICERLTDDDRYELAWIGESDPARNVVTPIEWAGTEGEYVESLEVSVEGNRGSGPVGQSLRTDSVAVTQRITEDPLFELADSLEGIAGLTDVTDGRISLTSTVRTREVSFFQYLRTEGVDPEEVKAVLETDELVRSVEVLWNNGSKGSLSVSSDSSPFTQTVGVYGGRLDEVVAEDGIITANVQFPMGANIHTVTDQLRSEYPELTVKAKRKIRPETEAQRVAALVEEELTDRQAEVLKAAYHSGYYGWPRDTNGSELSERLDLSNATLSQHLRAAHKKVVSNVVEYQL